MGSARDSSPDVNRASGWAHRSVQSRVRSLPPSGIGPATPARPPGAFSKSGAKVSHSFQPRPVPPLSVASPSSLIASATPYARGITAHGLSRATGTG